MGDVKTWFMGEKPMCYYLVCLPPFLSYPTYLLLVLLVGELLLNGCWWLRQLLSLGVGWQDCQSLAHAPTPPTTAFTPLSNDSSLPWYVGFSRFSVNPHAGFGLWMSHVEMSSASSCAPSFCLFAHIRDSLFCFLTMVDSCA